MKEFITSVLSLFFILTGRLFAQDVTIMTIAPAKVDSGLGFKVEYVVNCRIEDKDIEKSEFFEITSDPYEAYQASLTMKNGKSSMSYITNVSYLMKAKQTGTYTLPKVMIKANDDTYYSNSKEIEVVRKKKVEIAKVVDTTNIYKNYEYIFAEFSLSKQEVYLMEPVDATLKLYYRNDLQGIEGIVDPSFNGFLKMNFKIDKVTSSKVEVGNQLYYMAVLDSILLYPFKTGIIESDTAELVCRIRSTDRISENSIFENYTSHHIKAKAVLPSVKVKPFPGNEPENFTGIAGKDMVLTAEVIDTVIRKNEPFTLELTLSGTGNLKLLLLPELNLPNGLSVLSNEAYNDFGYKNGGISGERTFQYNINPQHEGKYVIPEVMLSYFDLNLQQYKMLQTEPVKIKVERGTNKSPRTKVIDVNSGDKDKSSVVVVMDVSKSMLAQDFVPDRISAVIAATQSFLQTQEIQLGVVAFSETSKTYCPVTSDRQTISDALSTLKDVDFGDGTAIGMGLGNAINELMKEGSESKIIILFTDGINNTGTISPINAATLANKVGIRIFTIGIGSDEKSVPITIMTEMGPQTLSLPVRVNEKELKEIASMTGGKYYRAANNDDLESIYSDIRTILK